MDCRGNLEVVVSVDIPEAETPGGPTRTREGNKAILGITSGGQDTEGEYVRGRY